MAMKDRLPATWREQFRALRWFFVEYVAPWRKDRGFGTWSDLGLLILGTLLSLGLAGWILAWQDQQWLAKIHHGIEIDAQALEGGLNHMMGDVQVLAQFYDASDQVRAEEFARFVRPFLSRHRTFQALEWAPRIAASDRATFEAAARAEGLNDYRIREQTPEGLQPAGDRGYYFPVFRVEPMAANQAALGFDLASEPMRRAAIEQACASGRAVATAPISLVRETAAQRAFLVFAPDFGPSAGPAETDPDCGGVQGLSVGVLRVGDFVEEALARGADQDIDLLFRDLSLPGKSGWLYFRRADSGKRQDFSIAAGEEVSRHPRAYEVSFDFAGRTLALSGLPNRRHGPNMAIPVLTLALGLAMTSLLMILVRYRRQSIRRLSSKEERLQLAVDASHLGLWDWDLATDHIVWSWHHERLWGLEPGEFDGTFEGFASRVHPGDLELLKAGMERCRKNHQPYALEFRVIWPDGSTHWILGRGEFRFDAKGKARRMIGTVVDITNGKEAEFAIRHFESIVRSSGDAIISKTLDGAVVSWNPAAEAIFGYRAEEMIGQSIRVLFPPERREEESRILDRVTAGERLPFFDSTRLRKDGSIIDVSVTVSPMSDQAGRIVGASTVVRDITARKKIARALHEEKARLRLLIDHAPAALAMFDRNMGYVACSQRWREDYGLEDLDLTGRSHYDIFPEMPEHWKLAHQRGLAGEQLSSDGEPFPRADGTLQWIRWEVCPWQGEDGEIAGIGIFTEDITALKEAELRLRRYQHIVETSNDVLIFVDKDLRLRIVNRAYAQLRRSTPRELEGRSMREVLGETDYAAIEPQLLAALAGEERDYWFESIYPDGKRHHFDVNYAPFWEDGEIRGLVASAHDISELQQARAALELERERLEERVAARTAALQVSEEKLRTVFDLLPVGIAITDPTGRIVDCNPASEQLLGIRRAEYLHSTYQSGDWQLIRPDGALMPMDDYASVRALRENRPVRNVEMGIRRSRDQIHWIMVNATPAPRPDYGVIVAYIDITERKRNERLSDEKAAAERANRAKSAFIANMSHELRTPLNAILGFAQVLLTDRGLEEGQREKLRIIKQSGDFLLQLINDVLDLAKIEAGRFELQLLPTNLEALLDGVRDMFQVRALQRGIELCYEVTSSLPDWVEADERRLRQILMGMLSNAVKFTERGQVRYQADYHNGQFRVVIEDTGIGIAPERLPFLFTPFEQGADQHYKDQGTGLGLAISDGLIRQMGGTIEVDSQLGKGSRFAVTLPLEICTPGLGIPPADSSLTLENVLGYHRLDDVDDPLRIMIVDDVVDNRQIVNAVLAPLGFAVIEAASGPEALALLAETRPDLVLMDIAMPEMDGLETTRRILARPESANLPVLALSAKAFADDRERSKAAGCHRHLAKPFDAEELFDALAAYLPLTWILDSRLGAPSTESAAPLDLGQLPPSVRQTLSEALISGWADRIETVIRDDIEVQHPALASGLRKKVRRYEYEELVTLLEQACSGQPPGQTGR